MAKTKHKEDDEITPSHIAAEALQKANNDVVKATDIMVARVNKDEILYRLLMDPLLKTACYNTITGVCRSRRQNIWTMPQPSSEEARENVVSLARGTAATLLDFPLPGGLLLRDAKRDDVSAAATFYSLQAKDMGIKAKWLQLIAQHLPSKKTVAQVMNDARLTELKQEASRE